MGERRRGRGRGEADKWAGGQLALLPPTTNSPAWPMCSEMTSRMVGLCVTVCVGGRKELGGRARLANGDEGPREDERTGCERATAFRTYKKEKNAGPIAHCYAVLHGCAS